MVFDEERRCGQAEGQCLTPHDFGFGHLLSAFKHRVAGTDDNEWRVTPAVKLDRPLHPVWFVVAPDDHNGIGLAWAIIRYEQWPGDECHYHQQEADDGC